MTYRDRQRLIDRRYIIGAIAGTAALLLGAVVCQPALGGQAALPEGFNLTTTSGLTKGCSEPEGTPANSACGFYVVGAAHALHYAELVCFPDDITNRQIYQAVAAEAQRPWIGEQIPDWGVPFAILELWGCAFHAIVGVGR